MVGAALALRDREGPWLDLLFVHPQWHRQGVATALVATAMNLLFQAGEQTLASGYHLANEPSVAWHQGFGFVEAPDLQLAQTRRRCARHELWRRDALGALSAQERETLERERDYWEAQVETREAIADRDGFAAVSPFFRRRH